MGIDIYHSRRINFFRCQFWTRDKRDSIANAAKLIYNKQPAGSFYARPVSAKINEANAINGVWMTDSDHITLETDDIVDELKRDCIVKYNDNLWIVVSVQSVLHLKESGFGKHQHHKTIITLTRG